MQTTVITTTMQTYFGPVEVLADPEKWPIHLVRGHSLTDGGLIDRRMTLRVRVAAGRCFVEVPTEFSGNWAEAQVERWGDGEYINSTFSPDLGELDRCGIVPTLCGTAADQSN